MIKKYSFIAMLCKEQEFRLSKPYISVFLPSPSNDVGLGRTHFGFIKKITEIFRPIFKLGEKTIFNK